MTRRNGGARRPAGIFAAMALALWLVAPAAGGPASANGETVEAVETRLYFGMHNRDGTDVTEAEWDAFLREVITPRFPDGLTVIEAYGQYRAGAAPEPIREDTMVLVIVHPDTEEANLLMAEIKDQFLLRFDQSSVFHTRQEVTVVLPPPQPAGPPAANDSQ